MRAVKRSFILMLMDGEILCYNLCGVMREDIKPFFQRRKSDDGNPLLATHEKDESESSSFV